MLSHNIRHVVYAGLACLAVILFSGGCGGTPKPAVKVIGVTDAQDRHDASEMLLVFLEVRNPTQRNIKLSRLEYELDAAPLFAASGNVQMQRTVSAGGSAVVQIPVRLSRADAQVIDARGVRYALSGTLFVKRGAGEATWPVRVQGRLASMKGSDRGAYMVKPTRATR